MLRQCLRALADVRRGEYEGIRDVMQSDPNRRPDAGPALMNLKSGATAVGATDNLVSTFYSPVWAQGVVFTVAILLIRVFPDGVMARVRRRA